ncbi:hypothetical protein NNC19_19235 [Clostridium sp. SHJSY1]|nr:hypothetical protein [Clostridium sp. SHJSY1]
MLFDESYEFSTGLKLKMNYLSKDDNSFGINFSKSSVHVVLQYHNISKIKKWLQGKDTVTIEKMGFIN